MDRRRKVRAYSKKIQELDRLNAWYKDAVVDTRSGYFLGGRGIICKSKSEYDKAHVDEINEILYLEIESAQRILQIYKNNLGVNEEYALSYLNINRCKSYYNPKANVSEQFYLKYEQEYLAKNNIMFSGPDANHLMRVRISYTSPQGRNHYRRDEFIREETIGLIENEIQKERCNPGYSFLQSRDRRQGNKIYVFSDVHQPGLCIGETRKENVEDRIKQEYKNMPVKPYELLYITEARKKDGSYFNDKDFHKHLKRRGYHNFTDHKGGSSEWFDISLDDIRQEMEGFKVERH
jgi:hypothetical protein